MATRLTLVDPRSLWQADPAPFDVAAPADCQVGDRGTSFDAGNQRRRELGKAFEPTVKQQLTELD